MRMYDLDSSFEWDDQAANVLESAMTVLDRDAVDDFSPSTVSEPEPELDDPVPQAKETQESEALWEAGSADDAFTRYTREVGMNHLLDAQQERQLALQMGHAFDELRQLLMQPIRLAAANEPETDLLSRDEALERAEALLREHAQLENAHLMRRCHRRIQQIRDQLVSGNLRLVIYIARRFRDRGVALEDLIQEGNIGLMRASIKFNAEAGVRFSTYGFWWISQAMRQAIIHQRSLIRFPNNVAEQVSRVKRFQDQWKSRYGEAPSGIITEQHLNISTKKLGQIESLSNVCLSMAKPLGEDGSLTLEDVLADEASWSLPHLSADNLDQTALLESLMNQLGEREALILRMKYGIGHSQTHSLREIASELGVSKERVRQIVHQATRTLQYHGMRFGID